MSTGDKARLARLRRLEKIRDVARQEAVRDVAEAESTLARLLSLSERTRFLSGEYASRKSISDGGQLTELGRFIAGLQKLAASTDADAGRARSIADARLHSLAEAEQRRKTVQERADAQSRKLASSAQSIATGQRKAIGTELE